MTHPLVGVALLLYSSRPTAQRRIDADWRVRERGHRCQTEGPVGLLLNEPKRQKCLLRYSQVTRNRHASNERKDRRCSSK